MIGAVIILLVTIAIGLMLWVGDRAFQHHHSPAPKKPATGKADTDKASGDPAPEPSSPEEAPHDGICCGRHLVCEKSLSPEPGEKIVYYDDEELDRYAGKAGADYTDEEVDEFRDVMQTMRTEELPGWVRSLQLRGVAFPLALRDELFLLLEECR